MPSERSGAEEKRLNKNEWSQRHLYVNVLNWIIALPFSPLDIFVGPAHARSAVIGSVTSTFYARRTIFGASPLFPICVFSGRFFFSFLLRRLPLFSSPLGTRFQSVFCSYLFSIPFRNVEMLYILQYLKSIESAECITREKRCANDRDGVMETADRAPPIAIDGRGRWSEIVRWEAGKRRQKKGRRM